MAKNDRRAPAGSTRKAPALPPSGAEKHLDVFANPAAGRDYVIQFVIPEFTCNCPLTGQPDFAQFTIEMIADRLCIELKSLKLYFWSYRDEGAFHEEVTNRILDDIVAATKPRFARIRARGTCAAASTPTWWPSTGPRAGSRPIRSGCRRPQRSAARRHEAGAAAQFESAERRFDRLQAVLHRSDDRHGLHDLVVVEVLQQLVLLEQVLKRRRASPGPARPGRPACPDPWP